MSRNAQVVRQWLLLERLERSKGATLEQLADSLPPDTPRHQRTIRRDLEALEARFPLVTERRQGKTVWHLMDGYDRSLRLAFSQTELMALVFSKDLLRPLDGTELKSALDSAFNKMVAALPSDGASFVGHLRDFFSVGLGPHKKYKDHRQTIDCLTRAISQSRTVQMRYFAASRNVTTRRNADPYRLWYAQGALYLIGYCHLRRDVRMFAVDRIRSVTITNKPCQMPLGFDLEEYVGNALMVMRGAPLEVRLRFDRKVAPWVGDRMWHPSQKIERTQGGAVVMTLQVADTSELVGWILSFGGGVRVLSPQSLRDRVHEEARRILRKP
jgi:predicted DNA-binding transcriptional regulator YafY